MKGSEFREIRNRLGLGKNQFAKLLGYTGNSKNNVKLISKYENEIRQIPLYMARFSWLLLQMETMPLGVGLKRDQWGMIKFPEWPGYVFEHQPDGHDDEGSGE